jgi:hypothetical protein
MAYLHRARRIRPRHYYSRAQAALRPPTRSALMLPATPQCASSPCGLTRIRTIIETEGVGCGNVTSDQNARDSVVLILAGHPNPNVSESHSRFSLSLAKGLRLEHGLDRRCGIGAGEHETPLSIRQLNTRWFQAKAHALM